LAHSNTVLSQFLALVPQDAIAKLAAEFGADRRGQKLTTVAQVKLLILSQLQGRQSLRDMVAELTHNPVVRNEIFPDYQPLTPAQQKARRLRQQISKLKGLPPAKRWSQVVALRTKSDSMVTDQAPVPPISISQVSRINTQRSSELWASLTQVVMRELSNQTEQGMDAAVGPLRAVDGSVITLSALFPWAEYSRTDRAVRLHVSLDLASGAPELPFITTGKVGEPEGASHLVTEPGVTYVFDRGYVDHKAFSRYCEQGIFFVTRLNRNVVYRVIRTHANPQDTVLADQVVQVGCKIRRVSSPLRLVTLDTPNHEPISFLTNRFDLTAHQIGQLYRRRWDIELFFRWVKQNLKLRHYWGRSKTAVHAQILAAFLTQCLLIHFRSRKSLPGDLLAVMRWVRHNLWNTADQDAVKRLAPVSGCQSIVARVNAV
jgi:hypothetical protein